MPAHVRRQCAIENNLPSQMLALEPRYLFDAAAVATVADVTSAPATAAAPPPAATAVAADLLVDGQDFAVFENTPAGTDLFEVTGGVLGDGFIDTTGETGALTWSKTGVGTGASAFTITADGRIQVLDPALLNFEVTPSYTLEVRAMDAFGGEDTTLIDITVADVNDPPSVPGAVPDQNVPAGNTLTVDVLGETGAFDEDGDPLSYELFEAPAGASIAQDGMFTWNTSSDQSGTTTITVLISNDFNPGLANTVNFDVTVDPALISISDAATVEEGNALQYTVSLNGATDPGTAVAAGVTSDSLYGVSLNGFSNGNPGPSDLYIIDEISGAGRLVGNIGYAVNSIAFDPTTGLMYGSTTTWSGLFNGLLQIDPATGAATEIGAFGSGFTSILGLSFNSAGELFGWHDPGADDPVSIDKATGAATTIGDAGIGTGRQVMAFDNSDTLILVQGTRAGFSEYDINLITGAASLTVNHSFNPGSGGADINNTTGDLWAPGTPGKTQDSIIRVTDLAAETFTDIDTDVDYLNALAFSSSGIIPPVSPAVTADLAFGAGTTATGGATNDGTSDYQTTFYSDATLTNPITSVMLGGTNPTSVDVYVRTFDNDPPFYEVDENVEVVLTNITNAAGGDTAADGIITDASLPSVSITGVDAGGTTVEEGTAAKFTVSLSGASDQPATVDLGALDGTADSTDYDGTQFYLDAARTLLVPGNVLTFAAGVTDIDVYVDTIDNDPPFSEADETFTLTATAATGATGTDSATGTITDATLPSVSITGVDVGGTTVEEGDAAMFTVSLSGASEQPATVDLGALDGTADSTDYDGTQFYLDAARTLLVPGNVLTFAAGVTDIDVYVDTIDNDPPYSEADETYTLTATAASGATGTDSATGTITDATPPPALINDATNLGAKPPSTESGDPNGEEESGEQTGEATAGPEAPGDTTPGDTGDEITPEEAAEIEAEAEALVTEGDFSETTEGPAAGKPDSQQPQTRAEEVAEILSLMDKAIALAGCRELPHGPSR